MAQARPSLSAAQPNYHRRVSSLRILLTVDESTGPLAAVRALDAAGYEVWLAASQPHTYAARSRAAAGVLRLTDPREDPDAYAQALAARATELGVAAVLPGTEATLRALTGKEALFPAGIAIGTCSRETLDRATDKSLLVRFGAEAGLETLPTVELTLAELDGRADELRFPAVVKPIASTVRTQQGALRNVEVEVVRSLRELRAALAAGGGGVPSLVQPYVAGTLAAICGVSWEGELVCASHQISHRIWPPGKGISSLAETVAPDRPREAGVARLLRLIGWSGVFGTQFLLAGDRAYLIDFNPRIYGSLALAVRAGHNLPAIWADLLIGRKPGPGAYRIGVRYRAEENDFRALAVELARGKLGALVGALPRRHTVHGVFSVRDPAPSLESLRKILSRGSLARGMRSRQQSTY